MSDKEKVIEVTKLVIPFGLFVVVAWWGVQNFFENQKYRLEQDLMSPVRAELRVMGAEIKTLRIELTTGRIDKSHYNVLRSELSEQGIKVSEYDILHRKAIEQSRPYKNYYDPLIIKP